MGLKGGNFGRLEENTVVSEFFLLSLKNSSFLQQRQDTKHEKADEFLISKNTGYFRSEF